MDICHKFELPIFFDKFRRILAKNRFNFLQNLVELICTGDIMRFLCQNVSNLLVIFFVLAKLCRILLNSIRRMINYDEIHRYRAQGR